MVEYELDIVKYFMKNNGHGNGLIIKGGVRKGKTTLISLITRTLLDNSDFVIISNVRFDNSVYKRYVNRIFFINSLEMYFNYIVNIPYTSPILLVLDDSQSKDELTSKGVMTKGGKDLSSFLIFIGKLHTSYIYVAHQKYIPSSILDGFEPLFIYKCEREDFVVSPNFHLTDSNSYGDIDSSIIEMPNFKSFNDWGLPILSIAFTDFKMNVNLEELYDRLTQYEVGESTKECIKEYLANSNKIEDSEYQTLKKLTYSQIYKALCFKKGELIGTGAKVRELFNPNILTEARKELKQLGLK